MHVPLDGRISTCIKTSVFGCMYITLEYITNAWCIYWTDAPFIEFSNIAWPQTSCYEEEKSKATFSGCPSASVCVSNVTRKHSVPPQGGTLVAPLSDHIHPPDSDSFWNASLAQNTTIYSMLSNTGNERFSCQQFRAPSRAVTVQSTSFGYGYADSLASRFGKPLALSKSTHKERRRQTEVRRTALRTSSCTQKRPKVSARNYTVLKIQFLVLQ